MPKYQATTNEREYPISEAALAAADIYASGPDQFHLLRDGKSYHVIITERDMAAKTLTLSVNGRMHTVKLHDETDQLVKQLGFATVATTVSKDAIAPMPGLVLEVLVDEGAEISAGTPLLILEAMKMENVLKAESDGTITEIHVAKGQAVEKKQLLITIT